MKILGEEISLLDNINYSLRNHWFLWLLLVLTAGFDFLTTLNFMRRDGIEFEKNLVVKNLALMLGIVPGVAVGKSLQIFAALGFSALSKKLTRAILLLIVLLNFWAIIVNTL
ncbi:MAG: hypothetical protein KTR18_13640 [Acidiferrobacterales bacterium]|nr:hypothetical protein [Acidiferrobacterales bacterium]